MNTNEKTVYLNSIVKYMDEQKVYAVFADLYKALSIEQPAHPLEFLIERLKGKHRSLIRETYFRGRSARCGDKGNNPQA